MFGMYICSVSREEADILHALMVEKKTEWSATSNSVLQLKWANLLDEVYDQYFIDWMNAALDDAVKKRVEIDKLVAKITHSHNHPNSIKESSKRFVKSSLTCLDPVLQIKTDIQKLVKLWHQLMQLLKQSDFFWGYIRKYLRLV